MAQFIKLDPTVAKQLRTVDERLMSYNVEMTEVTGGTFWKAYTPGQIAGTEPVPPLVNLADMVRQGGHVCLFMMVTACERMWEPAAPDLRGRGIVYLDYTHFSIRNQAWIPASHIRQLFDGSITFWG